MWLANRKSPENGQQYSPPLKRDLGNFLFWLVSEAYEKLSLIITTNKALQRAGLRWRQWSALRYGPVSIVTWIDVRGLKPSRIHGVQGHLARP